MGSHSLQVVENGRSEALIEETLSDGSRVYNIVLAGDESKIEIGCTSRVQAYKLWDSLKECGHIKRKGEGGNDNSLF